jgi:hypothetical protein
MASVMAFHVWFSSIARKTMQAMTAVAGQREPFVDLLRIHGVTPRPSPRGGF